MHLKMLLYNTFLFFLRLGDERSSLGGFDEQAESHIVLVMKPRFRQRARKGPSNSEGRANACEKPSRLAR